MRGRPRAGPARAMVTWSLLLLRYNMFAGGRTDCGLRGMTFWARLIIYAGAVLLYVGTAAWIVRAWTQRRYRDKSPSDLHYIAVGIVLVVSAGLGVLVASQIVMVLGYTG
jgi:uncharacterized membrane protein YidH (DUF202 family)